MIRTNQLNRSHASLICFSFNEEVVCTVCMATSSIPVLLDSANKPMLVVSSNLIKANQMG